MLRLHRVCAVYAPCVPRRGDGGRDGAWHGHSGGRAGGLEVSYSLRRSLVLIGMPLTGHWALWRMAA